MNEHGTDATPQEQGSFGSRLLRKGGVGAIATVAIGGVLLGGLGMAGATGGFGGLLDDSPTTSTTIDTTTTLETTTTVATTVPAPATRVIDVPGVGQVVVTDGPVPQVVSVIPLPGFSVATDLSPEEAGELLVRFVDANGARIDVKAEFEDGQLRIRIRDRRLEGDDGGRSSDDSSDDSADDSADDSSSGRGVESGDDSSGSGGWDDGSRSGGGGQRSGDDSSGSGGSGSDDRSGSSGGSSDDDSSGGSGRGGSDDGSSGHSSSGGSSGDDSSGSGSGGGDDSGSHGDDD